MYLPRLCETHGFNLNDQLQTFAIICGVSLMSWNIAGLRRVIPTILLCCEVGVGPKSGGFNIAFHCVQQGIVLSEFGTHSFVSWWTVDTDIWAWSAAGVSIAN